MLSEQHDECGLLVRPTIPALKPGRVNDRSPRQHY